MEKTIRYAEPKDRNLIIKMYLNEVEDHQQRAEQFADDLVFKLKTVICISDQEILGTISFDTRGGLNDGVVELVGLGVNPNFRQQGIAKEMVLTLIDEAKKHFSKFGYKLRVIYLFMEKNNTVGRSFYRNLGFRQVAEIPALYPQDDAVMWIKYF